MLIWGCPKRQTAPRVVYIPSPPAASEQTSSPASGTLVIQEPARPEPVEEDVVPEEQPAEEKSAPRRRRTVSPERPAVEPGEDTVETPPAEVPALEARESPAQQNALRQQIINLQAGIRGRISQLKLLRLSDLERKTIDDVQMFLDQSLHALGTNDLVRALNLARKASLLVNALEQKP